MVRSILVVALVASCLVLKLALAAPYSGNSRPVSHEPLSKRSFGVERVQFVKPTRRDASKAMRKALTKYGITLPSALSQKFINLSANYSAPPDGQTGSVEAIGVEHDKEFLSPINIGGQTMMVDFDTGSSDLWVFSTALPAYAQTGHTVFDPAQSSSFKQIEGASFRISFGDGSAAAGNLVGADVVDIGGATATRQVVELATSVSQSLMLDTNSNGIVGLGFSKINTVVPQQAPTFFDTIKDDLALPIFTASLRGDGPGKYQFGKIDNSSISSPISYMPVDSSDGFWQIDLSSFAVGNGPLRRNTGNVPIILDTGTTLMLLDENIVDTYYNSIKGAALDETQGFYTFPCKAPLKDLNLGLGPSYVGTIDKSLINWQELDGQAGMCVGSLQSNQGGNVQILGDTFFKSQFTVFNIKDETIGFAPHA